VSRIRSLLLRVEIDQAKRAHKCQANGRHNFKSGDTRLNVRNGRSWDRYCVDCARKILSVNLESLSKVANALESGKTAFAGEETEE
jgi:hypothetical protein